MINDESSNPRQDKKIYPEESASQEPTPITYDDIIVHDSYVTGIAHYNNPQGLGEFELRVNGSSDKVEEYGATARIVRLEYGPLNQEKRDALQVQRDTTLASMREYWHHQLEIIQRRVFEVDEKTLQDPEAVWALRENAEKIADAEYSDPDFQNELAILIEVLNEDTEDTPQYLSFVIDPFIDRNETRRYVPVVNGNWSVSATVEPVGPVNGDPDLRLYRGGHWRGGSFRGTGQSDSVYAQGGNGSWELQVRGYSASNYILYGDWTKV